MSSIFNPSGNLNVSWDPADLPGQSDGVAEASGEMTRCKNLRINQRGIASTRDGCLKRHSTAIETPIWWLEEMDGSRYAFASEHIYEDEVSLLSGLALAQWSAIQYNAYNDTTKQIFALNGTDRKRITAGAVNEWGIDAPTVAPTLSSGEGLALTGVYNAKYTYVRKVGSAIVSESNPSPAAAVGIDLNNQSLVIEPTQPTDSQVTHIRIYRTLANGSIYYLDSEWPVNTTYAYGYTHGWEADDAYIAGTGYKFTVTDSDRGTENTYEWESSFEDVEVTEDAGLGFSPYYGGQVHLNWDFSTFPMLNIP